MSDTKKVNKLLSKYLESMPSIQLMTHLTLKDIRPRRITQAVLAKELKRSRTTIGEWERGHYLDGINSNDIVKMAILYDRRIEEIVAAIQQTRTLVEEETPTKNN